jgi:hypothetical protein
MKPENDRLYTMTTKTITLKASHPFVRKMLHVLSAGRSRRPVRIEISATYSLSTEKSGGSWNDVVGVAPATGGLFGGVNLIPLVRDRVPAPCGLIFGTVDLTPELAIVEHSYFCGKDVGYRIHLHPDTPELLALLAPCGHSDCAEHPELAAACSQEVS